MVSSTLSTIEQKVRRLTRTPSEAQLSTAEIDNYMNTFILYDIPSQLRLFNLKKNFIFYTKPFIDTYSVNTTDPTDPLFNFNNLYITTDQPLYIAGYLSLFSQSQEQFYLIYPKINNISPTGLVGDGVTTTFTGVINSQQNTPLSNQTNSNTFILQNSVVFDSIDANANSLLLIDSPINTETGNLVIPNDTVSFGTINYLTGAFTLTFSAPPAAGQNLTSQCVIYVPARPFSMLYFNDQFIFRPVPDQAYKVEMQVFYRPTALIAENQSPQLEQWWQWIAYGAAKKIFEDRMDLESVKLIMPEFKEQENMVLRTTLVQNTKQRAATIYTEQSYGNNWTGWGFGGGQF